MQKETCLKESFKSLESEHFEGFFFGGGGIQGVTIIVYSKEGYKPFVNQTYCLPNFSQLQTFSTYGNANISNNYRVFDVFRKWIKLSRWGKNSL